jgi:hypothetical protein
MVSIPSPSLSGTRGFMSHPTPHDDRIIRVVGAVFFEIQQTQATPGGEGKGGGREGEETNVMMLLRDLIRESLDVIDVLCVSSTAYAEKTRDNREEEEALDHLSRLSYQSTSSLRYQHGQV